MYKPSRIIFMGTPAFAVPSLNALIEAGCSVVAVVTRPDKPRGRGMEMAPSAVKEAALKAGITVLEPVKINEEDFISKLRSFEADFIVVVAYGRILPRAVLEIPPGGCVNLHASLLPKYRGAAPINWAIIRGEKETGVCTMLMDRGLDTGAVLLRESTPIGERETAAEVAQRLSKMGGPLLLRTIGLINEGKITAVAQDESKASYAPLLKKEDGMIDWSRTAREIDCLVRGVCPWPGAYTHWQGAVIKVHKGRQVKVDEPQGERDAVSPGTVIETCGGCIAVRCGGEGSVYEILELQPENKKRMSAGDFLKGYRLKSTDVFY